MDPNPPGELFALLAVVFRAMTDRVHAGLAAEGHRDLRPAYGYTFQFLSHRRGATSVELAAHLGVTKQAAAQLVDELERLGYVARQPHQHDRRARTIVLTEQGWACIRDALALWRREEERWADLIGRDRLEALRAGLSAYAADAGPTPMKPVW